MKDKNYIEWAKVVCSEKNLEFIVSELFGTDKRTVYRFQGKILFEKNSFWKMNQKVRIESCLSKLQLNERFGEYILFLPMQIMG